MSILIDETFPSLLELEGFCDNKPNGKYNHPSRCDSYVLCSNGVPELMECYSGLHYDPIRRECVDPVDVSCLKMVGETLFGAKGMIILLPRFIVR